MDERKDIIHAHRAWLNEDPNMTGTIATYLELWKEHGQYVEANVELRDCTRSIVLDLGFRGDEKDFNKALQKLDNIVKMLEQLRGEMLSVYPLAKEAVEKHEKEKEENKKKNPHLGKSLDEVKEELLKD